MQARLKAIKWSLDVNCIDDDDGQTFQIMDVEQDSRGRLSMTLYALDIEDRLYIFQGNDYNWHMESHGGFFGMARDESILSFLKELQATIPPIK